MTRAILAALLLCAVASSASANDSEAEIAFGGLTLKKSDAISMDSEDLFISPEVVRVKYRFTNASDAPVETLVAFPLPDISPGDEDDGGRFRDPAALKFKTKADGSPITFDIVEQAVLNDADVTTRLKALNLPLNPHVNVASLNALPKADRDRLIADGLIRDEDAGEKHLWSPQWSLQVSMMRKQIFPAKTTVSVEHEYTPFAGGSVAGGLSASQRKEEWFKEKQRKYCIDREWLTGFDRRAEKYGDAYSETWLGYVLKTGANWKGPIKDFRLVVDKGKPDALVSFCARNVKKISPTLFESRRKNFVPDSDLNVLIVNWSR